MKKLVTIALVAASLSATSANAGVVDAADYTVWRDNLGSPPPASSILGMWLLWLGIR